MRIFLLFLCFIAAGITMAQNQDNFKYQAILRDANGEIVTNEDVTIRINILNGSDNGPTEYSEEHSITTNATGLISFNIGNGNSVSGDFSTIDWAIKNRYLQIELNRNQSGFSIIGTVPFLSVPYALHAQTVTDKDDADADPANEIQDLNLNGNILTITNNATGTEIDLSKYENTNTDSQNIALSGTQLSIDNGNSVDLSILQDGSEDADADPANEIQNLSISNDTIFLSDGGAVKLPASSTGFSGSYNDLTNVPANIDIDATDDFSGEYSDLNGAPTLSTVATSGDYSDLSNTPILSSVATTGSYNDLSDQPNLSGDATGDLSAVIVKKIQGQNVSSGTPSTGQVLKWTGSAWAPGSDATVSGGGVDGVVESIGVTGTSTKTISLGLSTDAPSSTLTADFTDMVDDADADATNEIQDLAISGNTLYITNNGSASEIDLSGYLDNTDEQDLIMKGDLLTISNGSTGVDLSVYGDDADADPSNEIQDIARSGNTLYLTNNGDAAEVDLSDYLDNTNLTEAEVDAMVENNGYLTDFTEVDGSTTNELQDLSLVENILTITNNGSATQIDLSAYLDDTNTQLSESEVDNFVANNGYQLASEDHDTSSTNEIQNLEKSGNTLIITNNTNATEIDLSGYLDNTNLTEAEVDDYVSNNGYQLARFDRDVSSTNEIQSLSILGDTISLTQGGKVTLPRKGWGGLSDDALFAVVNTAGDTVFAVYESGVRVYVDDSKDKAAKGGFAVATRNAAKGDANDILNVTGDSVRIYLNESSKAAKGGFAVATRNAAKGNANDILNINSDSVRIYLNDEGKAAKGGFAVATRNAAKGEGNDYFKVSTNTEAETINNESRIVFYPNKDALLAGTLLVENDSVGQNSANIGFQNIASGQYSQAFGYQAKARGNYSMAVGKNAVANGENTYAFGDGARAFESGAFAMGNKVVRGQDTIYTTAYMDAVAIGNGNIAWRENSVALGCETNAYGEQSFACGNRTEAVGYFAVAMGSGTVAEGDGATTMGSGTVAWGYNSTAMGVGTTTNGRASTTMGSGTVTNANYSLAIGRYNEDLSPNPYSLDPLNSLFMIGNGTNDDDRSNAFTVYQSGDADLNGQLTINKNSTYNSPHMLLHETGNDYARLSFDNTTLDKFWTIAGYSNSNDDASKMHFYYYDGSSGKNFMSIAGDGNIGINNSSPESELHITQTGTSSGLHGIRFSTSLTNEWNIYNSGSFFSFKLNGSRVAYVQENGDWHVGAKSSSMKNIKAISPVLSKLSDLKTISYQYNKNKNLSTFAFDAKKAQKLFPELVGENEDGELGISYSKFSVVAIKAIQEQQEIIEQQAEELNSVKKELEELRKMILEINN